MTTYLDPDAASVALLISDMESSFLFNRHNLRPVLSMPYTVSNWSILKYIWGSDALFNTQKLKLGDTVFYGVVARSKINNKLYLVLRGTETILEWIEDAEFALIYHPASGGKVEEGFYSVYSSLTVEGTPILDWLKANTNTVNSIVVSGHSLGASLSTYLAAEIKADKDIKAFCVLKSIASPKTGNKVFVNWCEEQFKGCSTVYNYDKDIVPDLPPLDDYATLPSATYISMYHNPLGIPDNIVANHMCATYAYMLDNNITDWKALPELATILSIKPSVRLLDTIIVNLVTWIISKIRNLFR